MFDKMSAFITGTLIEGKIIKMEERNLYLYCFGTLIEMTANLITTLIIGALLGKIVAALFFMLIFIPLRITAGGYHCETACKCYLLSMAVYLAVILTYDLVLVAPSYVFAFVCVFDLAAIIILSPVVSPNKPFTAREKIKNRRISIALSLIYLTAILVMMNCKIVYAFVILESLTAAVVSMIVGFIKYKKASKTTIQPSKTTVQTNFDTKR